MSTAYYVGSLDPNDLTPSTGILIHESFIDYYREGKKIAQVHIGRSCNHYPWLNTDKRTDIVKWAHVGELYSSRVWRACRNGELNLIDFLSNDRFWVDESLVANKKNASPEDVKQKRLLKKKKNKQNKKLDKLAAIEEFSGMDSPSCQEISSQDDFTHDLLDDDSLGVLAVCQTIDFLDDSSPDYSKKLKEALSNSSPTNTSVLTDDFIIEDFFTPEQKNC